MNITRKLSIDIDLPDTNVSELLTEHSQVVGFDIYDYGYSFGSYYPGSTYPTERHATNDYIEVISLLSNIISKMDKNIINKLIIQNYSKDLAVENILLVLIAKCCKWYQKQYTNLQFVLRPVCIYPGYNIITINFRYTDVNKFINDFDTADINYINNLIILANSTSYLRFINSIITTTDVFATRTSIDISKNYNRIHKANYVNKLYNNEICKNHKLCYLHIYLHLDNNRIINYDQDIKICIRNTHLEQLRIKLYPNDKIKLYPNDNTNKKHKNIYLRNKLLKNNKLTKIIFCYKSQRSSKINVIANQLISKLFDKCAHELCYINKNLINIYRKGNKKLLTKNMDILEYFNDLCKHKIYKNKFNKNMLIKILHIMYMNNIPLELIFIYMKYYLYD